MNKSEETRILPILIAAILTTEEGGEGEGSGGEGGEGTGDGQGEGTGEGSGEGTGEGEGEGGEGEGEGGEETGAPEAYTDFTLPEGMTLDEEALGEFAEIAKADNLSQEKAQKYVDMASKLMQKQIDTIMTQHQEKVGNWLKDAEKDPEIGDDIKKGAESAALRAFNTITKGDEKAKAMVDELGIGNHPEFLRIFYRISQHMREDTFEIPGTGGQGGKSAAETMYPSMKK
ncbi:MAG: hypothetical protein RQ754_02885 [Desulfuromonadales bacterium]|nr:hypothetical protein [Desulfuromonadales bacterium]